MFSTRLAFVLRAIGVALLVAGCSSGVGKHATSTTTAVTVLPPLVIANTGICPKESRAYEECILRHKPKPVVPCPQTEPDTSLAKLNAGVAGLNKKLVPIAAAKVWTCRWNSGRRLND